MVGFPEWRRLRLPRCVSHHSQEYMEAQPVASYLIAAYINGFVELFNKVPIIKELVHEPLAVAISRPSLNSYGLSVKPYLKRDWLAKPLGAL